MTVDRTLPHMITTSAKQLTQGQDELILICLRDNPMTTNVSYANAHIPIRDKYRCDKALPAALSDIMFTLLKTSKKEQGKTYFHCK